MHWTALLARHSHSPNAGIVADLSCVGCGYNLRGLKAGGRCSECGMAIGNSLFLLRKPDTVAVALRGIAWSWITTLSFVLLLAVAVFGLRSPAWIGLGLLLLAASGRFYGMWQLRYRSAIENLPVIGARMQWLWWLSIAEVLISFSTCVLFYLVLGARFGTSVDYAANLAGIAWLMTTLMTSMVLAAFCSSLALILGYDYVCREMLLHRVFLIGGATLAMIIGFIGQFLTTSVGQVLFAIAAGVLAITWCIALAYMIVGLFHLGSGAEKSTDRQDEVLENRRDEPGVARAPARNLPDIAVDD